MNTVDAKRVLETALICAQQPLAVRDMRVLFNDALGSDTIKVLLQELHQVAASGLAAGMGPAWSGVGAGGYRLAFSEPT